MQELEIIQNKRKHNKRLKELVSAGNFVAELHMHTTNSDGITSVKRALGIAKKKGIHLAITDHNTILNFRALTTEEKEVIIPAIEVTSNESIDVLAYFYKEEEIEDFYRKHIKAKRKGPFKTALEINELLMILKKYQCVVAIPHPDYPFDPVRLNFTKAIARGLITKKNLERIDLIEVFNAGHRTHFIERHKNLASKMGKPFVIGSDAHTPGSIANAFTYTKAKSKKSFLDKLKKGDINMIGRRTAVFVNNIPVAKQGVLYFHHAIGRK